MVNLHATPSAPVADPSHHKDARSITLFNMSKTLKQQSAKK
jgi:hypothetical protein